MILCVGDSWTKGWGVRSSETWPFILQGLRNTPVATVADHGSSNRKIMESALEAIQKYDPQYIIAGWSGVTRFENIGDMSEPPEDETGKINRVKFFKNATLDTLTKEFQECINKIPATIHFSVFGDQKLVKHKNMLDISFFEYLSQKQGTYFKYEIPFFEFDYLNENNEVSHEFFERNKIPNWKRACVEREMMREQGEYFLDCGHPNASGHKAWAEYINDRMGNIS